MLNLLTLRNKEDVEKFNKFQFNGTSLQSIENILDSW